MIRLRNTLILLCLFLFTILAGCKDNTVYIGTITNDVVWRDTDGNEILAQGGCIYREGNTFHWFGPHFGEGKDYGFKAINHYTSKDLQNWEKQPEAIKPGMKGTLFTASSWVGRPWVLYNKPTKKYVMVLEWGGGGLPGVRNRFVFYTSDSLDGPWKYTNVHDRLPDATGTMYSLGDLGAFQDDDGNAYLLYTFDKPRTNRAQAIVKLDPESYTRVLTPEEGGFMVEFRGDAREAASMIKRGSTYYYFTSQCMGWNSSVTRYRMAESLSGPWTDGVIVPTEPKSYNSFNTQHDFVLPIVGKETTSYIYCGDRWSNYTGRGVGRNAWYPMTFDEDGVPTIHGYTTWSINIKTGEIILDTENQENYENGENS